MTPTPRICSLLPSATEIVCALGLEHALVAITHECDYPPSVSHLPRITRSAIDHSTSTSREIHRHISDSVHSGSSVYDLDREMLERLRPDIVLTQELCDVCAVSYGIVEGAVRLMDGDCTVASLEPTTLDEILESILSVARLGGVSGEGSRIVGQLRERLAGIRRASRHLEDRPSVFACEWLDPLFAGGHWVPEMLTAAGGRDPIGQPGHPSFVVALQEVAAADPDAIVLMPCGYNLEQTAGEFDRIEWPPEWYELRAVRQGRLYAVDGSGYFNRPGPRVFDGVEILAEILHPNIHGRLREGADWRLLQSDPAS